MINFCHNLLASFNTYKCRILEPLYFFLLIMEHSSLSSSAPSSFTVQWEKECSKEHMGLFCSPSSAWFTSWSGNYIKLSVRNHFQILWVFVKSGEQKGVLGRANVRRQQNGVGFWPLTQTGWMGTAKGSGQMRTAMPDAMTWRIFMVPMVLQICRRPES